MNETHQDQLAADAQSARSERLVDYLYDELAPAERAAMDDELAQSPELAAELASLRGTRARFAALPAEPMPRGLLDDILKQADAQAATFANTGSRASASLFERALEGLKRLVFQPAFAMAVVLLFVAGVALVATRNPSEIAGMEMPRDAARLPPVAMAPAPVAKAAEAAPSLQAAPEPELAAAAALADRAATFAEPATEGEAERARSNSAELKEAKEDQPARFVEASVKGDFDDQQPSRPSQPAAARPTTVSKDEVARLEVSDAVGGQPGSARAPARAARGDAGPADSPAAEGLAKLGASGGKGSAAPAVTEPEPLPDSRNAPAPKVASGSPAPADRERALLDTARDEEAQSDKKAPVAPAETARAPARKAESEDEARTPSSPPVPAAKPTEPAAKSERLYTTLKQQLAAGAVADAEKSLAELARLEGESARVKQAREALARAKAASQTPPSDSKPLPEPAKTQH